LFTEKQSVAVGAGSNARDSDSSLIPAENHLMRETDHACEIAMNSGRFNEFSMLTDGLSMQNSPAG
jgi:hypothetical protein